MWQTPKALRPKALRSALIYYSAITYQGISHNILQNHSSSTIPELAPLRGDLELKKLLAVQTRHVFELNEL
jgi:hypothetical protein